MRNTLRLEEPCCEICRNKRYLKTIMENVEGWESSEKFSFVECQNCGLIFMSPRYRFEDQKKIYSKKEYWALDELANLDFKKLIKRREKGFGYLYKKIFKHKNKGVIFDVGMGNGLFLSKFKEKGWEVWGNDISSPALDFAFKKFGIKGILADFLSVNLPQNYFDVITLNNVLEHLHYPFKTLKKINYCLKRDGLLVLVVPNIESLGAKLFWKNWYSLHPGYHLFLFSPHSLKKMLFSAGFKKEKVYHSYFTHNYYSWFESIRHNFSPKFKKNKKEKDYGLNFEKKFGFFRKILKKIGIIFAFLGCQIGQIFKKGEVITVYARKI